VKLCCLSFVFAHWQARFFPPGRVPYVLPPRAASIGAAQEETTRQSRCRVAQGSWLISGHWQQAVEVRPDSEVQTCD
jgi:hypothetical protein